MNVRNLKRFLEYLPDDIEIRFASQPNWPFEYSIEDVYVVDLNEGDEYYNEESEEEEVEPNEVVYLVEGNQLGYLPHVVKKSIGW